MDDGFEIPDDILERYLPGAGEHNASAEIVEKRTESDTLPDELPDSKVVDIRGPRVSVNLTGR